MVRNRLGVICGLNGRILGVIGVVSVVVGICEYVSGISVVVLRVMCSRCLCCNWRVNIYV